ncbi:MAG: hypothetical protein COX57_02220 [Alphaproteobacteria bacterium CG_4_10_14_0_2_um_filter_63_37]|nr:MAG: hypothetical protein AUJ55_06615 [Proteobacteria bacterium CG1_02_64_396]PJA25676.1 MAG: hypothetical protein COX57_02220 [Alphaproteobacteria bacterium CG_4_10_14_0_2_um_filter_63_37]
MLGEEQLARLSVSSDVWVWEENWQALRVFLACSGSWRVIEGRRSALDLPSVHAAMQMLGVGDQADCLERVQTLEGEALRVWG